MEHAHGLPHNYQISSRAQALAQQAAAGARQSCMCRCAETARPREMQMSICLRRREFIAGLGGAAAWPLTARAQQRAMPVIGYLSGISFNANAQQASAIRQGLRKSGYVEGQNVTIEYRSANGQYDRLPAFAADLVSRQVAVIIAVGSTNSPQAAKAATSTIPIVFSVGTDPVATGLVSNLRRPEANLTGVTSNVNALAPKRLEILRQLLPGKT